MSMYTLSQSEGKWGWYKGITPSFGANCLQEANQDQLSADGWLDGWKYLMNYIVSRKDLDKTFFCTLVIYLSY